MAPPINPPAPVTRIKSFFIAKGQCNMARAGFVSLPVTAKLRGYSVRLGGIIRIASSASPNKSGRWRLKRERLPDHAWRAFGASAWRGSGSDTGARPDGLSSARSSDEQRLRAAKLPDAFVSGHRP